MKFISIVFLCFPVEYSNNNQRRYTYNASLDTCNINNDTPLQNSEETLSIIQRTKVSLLYSLDLGLVISRLSPFISLILKYQQMYSYDNFTNRHTTHVILKVKIRPVGSDPYGFPRRSNLIRSPLHLLFNRSSCDTFIELDF